jgi:acetyl-CoA carboxylase carboxyl transferase subunit beta
MGWFTRHKAPDTKPEPKEEIWTQCPSCKAHIYREEWEKNFKVCSRCNFHERLTWKERVDLLLDPKTFTEINAKITFSDPLKFADAKSTYAEKAAENVQKTSLNEAVVTGHGKINGLKVALAVMDFRFLGGSLASGTGDKILRAAEYALSHRYPYIVISASGGARMHEGIISLMQMPKTCAALARLRQAGVPYISILTDPTTGGVSASYAMVGDIHIAEPRALIGFAGRRVIEETIKQKLPDDFQTAEYLLDHGFIDLIVPRKDMKDSLHRILKYCVKS